MIVLASLSIGSLGTLLGIVWLICETRHIRKEIKAIRQVYQTKQTALSQQVQYFNESRETISLRLQAIGTSPLN